MIPDARGRWGARAGVTLIEVLLAAAIFLALFSVVFAMTQLFWRQGAVLSESLTGEHALRMAFLRMTGEIREARRLFFPVRGGETADGVAVVSAAGETVVFFQGKQGLAPLFLDPWSSDTSEKAPAKGPSALYRTNINRRETVRILPEIEFFRATLYPPLAGQDPTCVGLHLATPAEGGQGPSATHSFFTRVFLRNVDRAHPDE